MWSKIKDTFLFFTEGEGAWYMFTLGLLGRKRQEKKAVHLFIEKFV